MELFISLSKFTLGSEGMAVINSPCTTPDLKRLASLIFGLSRFDKDVFGTIATRKGDLSAVRQGEEGAIWLLGDQKLMHAKDFMYAMKPMPMLTPKGAGDYYLTLNVTQKPTQFLIVPKDGNSILWFKDDKALLEHYAEIEATPAVKSMLTGNRGNASVMRSWSASVDDEDVLEVLGTV